MASQTPEAEPFPGRFFGAIPHMRECGVRVGQSAPGRATLILPARPEWLGDPQRGMLHPGPLTMLADSTCGAAVATSLDRVAPYATLDLRMDWLRPAGPERDVSCTAECFRVTSNIAFTRATLWQAGDEAPIATALATFMLGTATKRRSAAPAQAAPAAAGATATAGGKAAGAAGGAGAAPSQDGAPQAAGAGVWHAPADSEPIAIGRTVPYIDFLGMRVSHDAGQAPLYRMPHDEKLIGNPMLPALHGGVVAAFAESAATLHLIETLPEPKFPKGIDFSIDYLRSGRPEESFARCETVRVGSRVALVQVWCWQSSLELPIALARGHFLLADPDAE